MRRAAAAGRHASTPLPVPLRRGAAVVAVAGGALSLVGAAAPVPLPGAATALVRLADSGPTVLRPAVEPVALEPEVVDATDLVKAVRLTESALAAERQAAEKAAQKAAAARGCGLSTTGLGAVKPWVRDAATFLGCLFGRPTMYGVAGRAGASDHPLGRAVDFVVDRTTGDALAACALRNRDALGITYVIWRQRIDYGSGWQAMEDRGGVTANHFDHVHVSFGTSGGSGAPSVC